MLLQGFDPEAVAVFVVESSLFFDRCGCILPLSPVLRGTQAAPLGLVLHADTGEEMKGRKHYYNQEPAIF